MWPTLLILPLLLPGPAVPVPSPAGCPSEPARAVSERGLRCRFGAMGPGRFGLLSYADVPVYQPATPMPGTHVVGIPGHAHPFPGESYEAWEWRVLRTRYGSEAEIVHRELALLDREVARRVELLEAALVQGGVRAVRRETWRSPVRQAYLFQQGRSRPGPLATATLTSWHSQVDDRGRPAGRAVDYDVAPADLPRFHSLARGVGLESFGAESFDPGHVFLPERVDEGQLVLLRALDRVPEVTLSTGLPSDHTLPPGGRSALRLRAVEFAQAPFLPVPAPGLSRRALPVAVVLWFRSAPAVSVPPACASEPPRRAAERAAGGGARCGSRRSAARSQSAGGRSTHE